MNQEKLSKSVNYGGWILTLLTLIFLCSSCAMTSIHLVRHADRLGGLDSLSVAGELRAEELKRVLDDADIDVIYASTFRRTQRTAEPLANALGIPVTIYNAGQIDDLVSEIKANHVGKNVLIVGHSNTVPQTINEFGVNPIFPNIPEDVFDRFYQVVLCGSSTPRFIEMKYGAQTP